MNYELLRDVVDLLQDFDEQRETISNDLEGFKHWISSSRDGHVTSPEATWEGKQEGRSQESIICTLIVHMGRYAKNYSKAAIQGTEFATQEEFIYLINLKSFGSMSKMELIRKNVQDKPAGIQIINRLIKQGWVQQNVSDSDKRSKIVSITQKGIETLEREMKKIRQASRIVTAGLSSHEKDQLIRLLLKLEEFHNPIFLGGPVTPTHLNEIATKLQQA